MDITARKRAMCLAASWIALPAVLGASLNPSNDSPPVDADTRSGRALCFWIQW